MGVDIRSVVMSATSAEGARRYLSNPVSSRLFFLLEGRLRACTLSVNEEQHRLSVLSEEVQR